MSKRNNSLSVVFDEQPTRIFKICRHPPSAACSLSIALTCRHPPSIRSTVLDQQFTLILKICRHPPSAALLTLHRSSSRHVRGGHGDEQRCGIGKNGFQGHQISLLLQRPLYQGVPYNLTTVSQIFHIAGLKSSTLRAPAMAQMTGRLLHEIKV